ncbi:MAG: neutral/alkaline non-lysosomal ceramidase N-terminal domain-containing protein [Flavobacteriaceae bacterium]
MKRFKSIVIKTFLCSMLFLLPIKMFSQADVHMNEKDSSPSWKAGVAKKKITPLQPIWMAGYGNRTRPSEGKLHDLWAKALVLEDAKGERSVLITTDLLGVTRRFTANIRKQLKEKFNLSDAQVMINSSHTHSGPVLENALVDIYPIDNSERGRIKQYTDWLEKEVIKLVQEAYASLEPVKIYSENGVTRFQVNRRNNNVSALLEQTELKGPNDYSVPVLKVENNAGKIKAIVFGYACHATVLNGYEWSGDYPGFAQLELEKKYEGVTAMFFQGAGADQNPLPRHSIALAQQYGRDLASAVERVLNEDMPECVPELVVSYSEIELPFAKVLKRKNLIKIKKYDTGYRKRWATRMLDKIDRGESFPTSYPNYPLQLWQIGGQKMFSMGGEVVIDYAIKLKQIFGQDIFVLGYTNDVMGYIPSPIILKEGGYEGASSQVVYGLPALWDKKIQNIILKEIIKMSQEIDILPKK